MGANIIPNALRVMLDQLFSNNLLKSWGVFPNQYGQICLNIRFDICEVGHSASEPVKACAFRRVSDKQIFRNANRITNNNKRRKLNPTTPDTNIPPSPAHIFLTTPELPRTCDTSVTPDNVICHSPEAVSWITENPDFHIIDSESPSPTHAPPSTPSSPSKSVNQPSLKLDSSTQVEYYTNNITTQVDRACFQNNRSTQCGPKSRLKSTQTALVECSDESIQVVPEPVTYKDSFVQYQVPVKDKCVQFGSAFSTNVDTYTQMSPPIKSDINRQREPKRTSAPRYNKTLGHPTENCETFCYLAGFKIFDEKGHSGHCYHRCVNCQTFICHVCIDDVSLYHWASCCKNPKSDGVVYSSGLTPNA